MTLKELKEEVYDKNLELVRRGLVIYTWGNVSAIDREREIVIIKPRGIEYEKLTPEDMSVVNMKGELIEGKLLPSVDLDIHMEIYKAFENVGGIAHTHSVFATSFSQALQPIISMGTTHADHFNGDIPCIPYLSKQETEKEYEKNLGLQIVRYFVDNRINPEEMGAVLAGGHGPFTWGKNAAESVEHSVILEELAKMAVFTHLLGEDGIMLPHYMQDKHYYRKYGSNAYFYQEKIDG
ncbi:L-ribulose-5-phosphate 4-epimerase AraD [Lachnospiraceae bacterium]|nr:L-ribulose-5-phosphate 4-epimerase AraD [Lachnospiraceae bacterium]